MAPPWRPLAPPTGTGPLDGLRLAVKDLFAVAGHAVGAGNPTWLASAPPSEVDATAVARLRAAGASVVGLAQTDELAFSLSGTNIHYGTPPNPAAPDRVTGGSSSGPAAAVALGEADVGLGTDTGGSIRVPASCCGLFGIRPTHGAVPSDGVLGLAPSFDTVGWLTRDAATLRTVGSVLLPAKPVVPARRVVAVPEVAPDARRAAATWGAEVEVAELGWEERLPALLAAFRQVQAAEAWRLHGAWIRAHPGALADDVEARFRYGDSVTAADELRARALLRDWRAEVGEWLSGAWLALPAAGGPGHPRAVTVADKDAWRVATLRRTVLASACGLPSAVLPLRTAQGPQGLAVVGAAGDDHGLLEALARAA
ncbi:amidase family protein [Phytohabitans rumicis]|uniref:amidase family protein n=1 Tax=Phytohabitans rumicis TaxID=1076125 RepID=UPI001C499B3C|nr:amidase family protein [Phytohabitans rumicis]